MRLTLSPAAGDAARRDLEPDQMLRVAFAGGCGAPGFRLAPTRRALEGDVRVEVAGITVLLDRQAARELDGATVDYDPERGFILDHPAWGLSC